MIMITKKEKYCLLNIITIVVILNLFLNFLFLKNYFYFDSYIYGMIIGGFFNIIFSILSIFDAKYFLNILFLSIMLIFDLISFVYFIFIIVHKVKKLHINKIKYILFFIFLFYWCFIGSLTMNFIMHYHGV